MTAKTVTQYYSGNRMADAVTRETGAAVSDLYAKVLPVLGFSSASGYLAGAFALGGTTPTTITGVTLAVTLTAGDSVIIRGDLANFSMNGGSGYIYLAVFDTTGQWDMATGYSLPNTGGANNGAFFQSKRYTPTVSGSYTIAIRACAFGGNFGVPNLAGWRIEALRLRGSV
jgi:hypothetical protein